MTQPSPKFSQLFDFIKNQYPNDSPILLHAPRLRGNESAYLQECVDTEFVSSVGKFVDQFELDFARFTGAKHAVAVVNGTQALYIGMYLMGVTRGDLVLTQSLTFVATANAIAYTGAEPFFLDVDPDTLGLSHQALEEFLEQECEEREGSCYHKASGKRVSACVPMHTLGHPCRIDLIQELCESRGIPLIEDAAESLGSYYRGKHTGLFGKLGAFSFNGNKVMTTGGGGMIVTDDEALAKRAKHVTTTAKLPHKYEFDHDEMGFNYRMPNINAALGVAQLERLPEFLADKRKLAAEYQSFCQAQGLEFFTEPEGAQSNYWLNALLLEGPEERQAFLEESNGQKILCRGLWRPMHQLSMCQNFLKGDMTQTERIFARIVNLPSSVRV